MPYVTKNGEVKTRRPFGLSLLKSLFWDAVEFIILFIQTLVNPSLAGSKNSNTIYNNRKPGQGPPPGPKRRGTFQSNFDGSCFPMASGGG